MATSINNLNAPNNYQPLARTKALATPEWITAIVENLSDSSKSVGFLDYGKTKPTLEQLQTLANLLDLSNGISLQRKLDFWRQLHNTLYTNTSRTELTDFCYNQYSLALADLDLAEGDQAGARLHIQKAAQDSRYYSGSFDHSIESHLELVSEQIDTKQTEVSTIADKYLREKMTIDGQLEILSKPEVVSLIQHIISESDDPLTVDLASVKTLINTHNLPEIVSVISACNTNLGAVINPGLDETSANTSAKANELQRNLTEYRTLLLQYGVPEDSPQIKSIDLRLAFASIYADNVHLNSANFVKAVVKYLELSAKSATTGSKPSLEDENTFETIESLLQDPKWQLKADLQIEIMSALAKHPLLNQPTSYQHLVQTALKGNKSKVLELAVIGYVNADPRTDTTQDLQVLATLSDIQTALKSFLPYYFGDKVTDDIVNTKAGEAQKINQAWGDWVKAMGLLALFTDTGAIAIKDKVTKDLPFASSWFAQQQGAVNTSIPEWLQPGSTAVLKIAPAESALAGNYQSVYDKLVVYYRSLTAGIKIKDIDLVAFYDILISAEADRSSGYSASSADSEFISVNPTQKEHVGTYFDMLKKISVYPLRGIKDKASQTLLPSIIEKESAILAYKYDLEITGKASHILGTPEMLTVFNDARQDLLEKIIMPMLNGKPLDQAILQGVIEQCKARRAEVYAQNPDAYLCDDATQTAEFFKLLQDWTSFIVSSTGLSAKINVIPEPAPTTSSAEPETKPTSGKAAPPAAATVATPTGLVAIFGQNISRLAPNADMEKIYTDLATALDEYVLGLSSGNDDAIQTDALNQLLGDFEKARFAGYQANSNAFTGVSNSTHVTMSYIAITKWLDSKLASKPVKRDAIKFAVNQYSAALKGKYEATERQKTAAKETALSEKKAEFAVLTSVDDQIAMSSDLFDVGNVLIEQDITSVEQAKAMLVDSFPNPQPRFWSEYLISLNDIESMADSSADKAEVGYFIAAVSALIRESTTTPAQAIDPVITIDLTTFDFSSPALITLALPILTGTFADLSAIDRSTLEQKLTLLETLRASYQSRKGTIDGSTQEKIDEAFITCNNALLVRANALYQVALSELKESKTLADYQTIIREKIIPLIGVPTSLRNDDWCTSLSLPENPSSISSRILINKTTDSSAKISLGYEFSQNGDIKPIKKALIKLESDNLSQSFSTAFTTAKATPTLENIKTLLNLLGTKSSFPPADFVFDVNTRATMGRDTISALILKYAKEQLPKATSLAQLEATYSTISALVTSYESVLGENSTLRSDINTPYSSLKTGFTRVTRIAEIQKALKSTTDPYQKASLNSEWLCLDPDNATPRTNISRIIFPAEVTNKDALETTLSSTLMSRVQTAYQRVIKQGAFRVSISLIISIDAKGKVHVYLSDVTFSDPKLSVSEKASLAIILYGEISTINDLGISSESSTAYNNIRFEKNYNLQPE